MIQKVQIPRDDSGPVFDALVRMLGTLPMKEPPPIIQGGPQEIVFQFNGVDIPFEAFFENWQGQYSTLVNEAAAEAVANLVLLRPLFESISRAEREIKDKICGVLGVDREYLDER